MKGKIQKSNIFVVIFVFAIMIMNAAAENVRGVFIPLFKRDFLINNTEIGFMLMISSAAYIAFSYIGGILCEKVGQKKVFLLGLIAMVVSLSVLSFAHNFFIVIVGMFIMNMGLALVSIAINTLIPVLFLSFQAIIMNLTHFCYGLGSTVTQRTTGILVFNGINWRRIYLVEAVLFSTLLVLLTFVKIPIYNKEKTSNKPKSRDILKNKVVYFYMAALGFYVFAETSTGNWLVNYIEKLYSYDKSKSSFYLALFFGVLTIGRLIGGFIVERLGYMKTVLMFLITAFVLYISGLLIGEKGLIIVSISGFFFSVAFPTIVLTISRVFKESSSYATGVIITASSTINMLLSLVMGYLNDKIGVQAAFYFIPISLIISILSVAGIYKNTKTVL
jgi:fucose permease